MRRSSDRRRRTSRSTSRPRSPPRSRSSTACSPAELADGTAAAERADRRATAPRRSKRCNSCPRPRGATVDDPTPRPRPRWPTSIRCSPRCVPVTTNATAGTERRESVPDRASPAPPNAVRLEHAGVAGEAGQGDRSAAAGRAQAGQAPGPGRPERAARLGPPPQGSPDCRSRCSATPTWPAKLGEGAPRRDRPRLRRGPGGGRRAPRRPRRDDLLAGEGAEVGRRAPAGTARRSRSTPATSGDTGGLVERIGARYREWKNQSLERSLGEVLAVGVDARRVRRGSRRGGAVVGPVRGRPLLRLRRQRARTDREGQAVPDRAGASRLRIPAASACSCRRACSKGGRQHSALAHGARQSAPHPARGP